MLFCNLVYKKSESLQVISRFFLFAKSNNQIAPHFKVFWISDLNCKKNLKTYYHSRFIENSRQYKLKISTHGYICTIG